MFEDICNFVEGVVFFVFFEDVEFESNEIEGYWFFFDFCKVVFFGDDCFKFFFELVEVDIRVGRHDFYNVNKVVVVYIIYFLIYGFFYLYLGYL